MIVTLEWIISFKVIAIHDISFLGIAHLVRLSCTAQQRYIISHTGKRKACGVMLNPVPSHLVLYHSETLYCHFVVVEKAPAQTTLYSTY